MCRDVWDEKISLYVKARFLANGVCHCVQKFLLLFIMPRLCCPRVGHAVAVPPIIHTSIGIRVIDAGMPRLKLCLSRVRAVFGALEGDSRLNACGFVLLCGG